jgi:hypothetical protein
VTGGWRKLHNGELHYLTSSASIVRILARMWELRNANKILVEKLNGRHHSEDLRRDRRMILKWILEKMWIRDAKWIHLAQCRY